MRVVEELWIVERDVAGIRETTDHGTLSHSETRFRSCYGWTRLDRTSEDWIWKDAGIRNSYSGEFIEGSSFRCTKQAEMQRN